MSTSSFVRNFFQDQLNMTQKDITSHPERNNWLNCEESRFLQDCQWSEFQSSGPGGQKRNRKYSAIRVTHIPSGRTVTAVESRSQNENKATALKKIRRLIAMEIRCERSPALDTLVISMRNEKYPLLLAMLFDTLHQHNFSIADAAKALELSTNQLVKILAKDTDAWQKVNQERQKREMKALKIKE